MTQEEEPSTWARALGLLGAIVADIVGFTGAGAVVGYLGTKNWGWPSWSITALTLVGFAVAMVQVYRVAKKVWDEAERP